MFQHTAARRRLDTRALPYYASREFQHTAARRRLEQPLELSMTPEEFQHTAARRRLAEKNTAKMEIFVVSTHSRPKAAGMVKN